MIRRPFLVGTAGVAVLIAGLAFFWPRRDSLAATWDPPAPGTVVAESSAPDSALIATVRAADSIGHYVFELRKPGSDTPVASREIAAPVGYHPQRVTVEWEASGQRAVAVIDHDFGDNPLRFSLIP